MRGTDRFHDVTKTGKSVSAGGTCLKILFTLCGERKKHDILKNRYKLGFCFFTKEGLQPVFHQTEYRGVFTVLCTVLSTLIVLFVAILFW
jgi:hypothetical protein